MKIFGPIASRAMRALWILEELGVQYEHVPVNMSKGEHRTPEYLNLNPSGKVPVLVDGDFVLFESGAICNYLAEQHPGKGLIPASGSRERALYDQWMFFCVSELEQPLWTIGKHTFALPDDKRVPEVIETAKFEFSRAVAALEAGLGDSNYLVGDRFTCADIMAGQTLLWAMRFKIPFKSVSLTRYVGRLRDRPALQAVLQMVKTQTT